jgi:predicted nucleic acid-binding protein
MPDRIIDTCCLVNVFASGCAIDILQALGPEIFVPDLVRNESLFIRKEDDQDPSVLVPEAIDLSDAIAQGTIQECRLESVQEFNEFVRLASILDDGEAICIALAKCRTWTVATDDLKALRVARAEGVQTITTPEIVKNWADSCSIVACKLSSVVQKVERFARFAPRKNAILRQWWEQVR